MGGTEQQAAVSTTPVTATAHHHDLGFTIIATPADDGCRVHFSIYAIEGWDKNDTTGEYDRPVWHKANSPSYPDCVDDIADAAIYLHGEVKWDGCSSWYFDEQDRGMLHGCSRHALTAIGEVMAACWDMAGQLMPTWDGEP